MPGNRCVLAIDPLTSAVSMTKMIEGDPIPKLSYTTAAPVTGKPTLAEAAARINSQVTTVVAKVTAAEPELVIMPRLFVGTLTADPSGPRRAGLYWAVVSALSEAGIPVADFPTLTLERYAGLTSNPGYKSIEKLAEHAKRRWPGARRDMPPGFRWTTLMFAAVGCAAVGIPTAVEVTPTRLKLLKGGTWPGFEVTLAKSVEEWKKQHSAEVKLGAVGEEKESA